MLPWRRLPCACILIWNKTKTKKGSNKLSPQCTTQYFILCLTGISSNVPYWQFIKVSHFLSFRFYIAMRVYLVYITSGQHYAFKIRNNLNLKKINIKVIWNFGCWPKPSLCRQIYYFSTCITAGWKRLSKGLLTYWQRDTVI